MAKESPNLPYWLLWVPLGSCFISGAFLYLTSLTGTVLWASSLAAALPAAHSSGPCPSSWCMCGKHWAFGGCTWTSHHPSHTLWPEEDFPSTETLVLVGKESGESDSPAAAAPIQMWQVQGWICRLPAQVQADKSISGQDSTPRAPFRLVLGPWSPLWAFAISPFHPPLPPGGGGVVEVPPGTSSTPSPAAPFLSCLEPQQNASDAGGDSHPGAAGFPTCRSTPVVGNWGSALPMLCSYLELLVGQMGRRSRTHQRPAWKWPQGEAEVSCKGYCERIWATSLFYL